MDQKTRANIARSLLTAAARLEKNAAKVSAATKTSAGAEAKIPQDFQIYAQLPGAAEANAAIAAAVTAMRDEIIKASKDTDIGPKFLNALVKKHISPVFKEYGKFGTGDGEPGSVVAGFLRRLLVGQLGVVSEWSWDDIREELAL